MGMTSIDARVLQNAFLAGAQGLEANKEWINELNVFPVPDGDTGTNMTMTIMSAAKEVAAISNPTIESICKAISSGSLRGARGNSGVILSQLFRGFTKEIKSVSVIDTKVMASAFTRATETAYKAVMKPKEGTILTVAKGMAEKSLELAEEMDDIIEFAEKVIEHGDYVLSQTPEMLPVLKEAGVVDSGGQGLMQVLKGALEGLKGKKVTAADLQVSASKPQAESSEKAVTGAAALENVEITFGYCTEFIINVEKEAPNIESELKEYLSSIGDSLVVVAMDDIVKIHVHTNDPGLAIQKGLSYGSLSRMKIDNMREEHQEKLIQNSEKVAAEQKAKDAAKPAETRKAFGFISVSVGDGMSDLFKELGVDYIISGGQTMNPSTEDILNAVDQVNADTIFVLPNNKNIILAAEQAASLSEDKKLIVVPSKTVPQGVTAVINFVPELSVEENLENMKEEMSRVLTGEVTYAVRNTSIDGMEIHEGDIMGIGDGGMLAVGKEINETAAEALKKMIEKAGEAEIVTIYYGADTTEDDANAFLEMAEAICDGCEVELQYGGQPIYYYMISVE